MRRKTIEIRTGAMAERAGRGPDDLAVRAVAGAVVGAAVSVAGVIARDPDAEIAPLIDQAIAHLEPGLVL